MGNYEEIYANICRICLSFHKKETMVCLTDDESEDGLTCFGKSVLTFANISIRKSDKLPNFMCQKCLWLLKQAISFKLKCESSDKQLIQITKLSENLGHTEEEMKEDVVQNIMFTKYFPEESASIPHTRVNKTQSEDTIPKNNCNLVTNDNTENDIDFDVSFRDNNNEQSQTNSEIDSADELLKEMEKIVGCYPNLIDTAYKSYGDKKNTYKHTLPARKKSKPTIPMSQISKMARNQPSKTCDKYICNICNKDLSNPNTFKYHMQRHNGCKYICEHCGKGFPVLAELQLHLVSLHGTGPHLPCQYCSFKAPRKFILIEHERIHTGERPYTCDKCGLTFRRRAIWRKHMIYHTEKTVQCLHCPRKFFVKSEMLAHVNSMHDRKYVYLCHKCDATYAKIATVRRHLTERHGISREMQGKVVRINKGRAAVIQRNNID